MVKNVSRIIALMLVSSTISASQLVFQFHSPSFSGVGQSSHYLTIENLEKSREDAIIAKAEAEEERIRLEELLKKQRKEMMMKKLKKKVNKHLTSEASCDII